ncbi:MAG: glutamyl-tRNA reductase [Bacteroidota bacterium]|nr:MAG: glutamyl-tRNA reductase [Bacteroidota bacterium]
MIGVLGINHKTAAIDIREKFSIPSVQVAEFGELILQKTEITETVILSTCNRTEIYYYHQKACIKRTDKMLRDLLHQYKNISEDYSEYFYTHSNIDAVNHLFSVTSGLDSMVLGEDQIVNQVKEAYLLCTNLALTDAVLMRLFQKNFETAKKVRTETNIQHGASSISFVAVDKCMQLLHNNLKDKKVFIIGTGKTSRLVLEKMKKQGVSNFLFANRTFESAALFAEKNNGFAVDFADIKKHLNDYDIVITATGAGHVLFDKNDIHGTRAQVFIDLAVPRNIHPNVCEWPQARLITIDNLQDDLKNTANLRYNSRKDAEIIIDQMSGEFFTWVDNRSLRPVIKAITENMQKMHQVEIEGYRGCYEPETLKAIDEYAGRLTQKYIRTLIKKLKELNENGNAAHSLNIINHLFEFDLNDKSDVSQ